MNRRALFIPIMLLFVLGLYGCSSLSNKAQPQSLRIMSFNIRLNIASDGDNAWPYRKEIAASMIRFHNADIAGLQEALKNQIDDLEALLPEYAWIGIGRDDAKERGEYAAIYYRKDRIEPLESSTFWLSETPEKPGFGWDAAYNRVVTWGKFKDIRTGKVFYLFNTHFDNRGEIARRESAKLLLGRVQEIAGDSPVVVTGDFNARPSTEPYQILTDENNNIRLTDSRLVSLHPHHGPTGTWSGFENAGNPGDEPIDHIFIKNRVNVIRHGVLSDTFNGRFPTDHMPVLAEIIVE